MINRLTFFLMIAILTASITTSKTTDAQSLAKLSTSKVGDGTSDAADLSPVVIVHGAWGGAHHWRQVNRILTVDHGYEVIRASLTGLGHRSHLASEQIGLKTHIRDVVQRIEFDDLRNVVLIGHSYGGIVAMGVVDAIPNRISRVVLIDSNVIESGQCHLENQPEAREKLTRRANEDGDGYLIPVDWKNTMRDTPHPLATLTDPLEMSNPWPANLPTSYWLLCDGGPAEQDDRFRYQQHAEELGWSTKTLPWNHNPHRHRPQELVAELLETLR